MEIDFDLIDEAIVACIAKQNDPAKVTALFDLSGDIRAEIARLTEENRVLREYADALNAVIDCDKEGIVEAFTAAALSIKLERLQECQRHREEASR